MPTTPSPKVMMVISSKRSARWGKLMMLMSKLPRMKNGRKAPTSTAATSSQRTAWSAWSAEATKAAKYSRQSTLRIKREFFAAPVSCSFSRIWMEYIAATQSSMTSIARLKVSDISLHCAEIVFAM